MFLARINSLIFLKKSIKNPSRKSRHHTKQSKFEGSDRQIRGKIVKNLLAQKTLSIDSIVTETQTTKERVQPIFEKLEKEGFCVAEEKEIYAIL